MWIAITALIVMLGLCYIAPRIQITIKRNTYDHKHHTAEQPTVKPLTDEELKRQAEQIKQLNMLRPPDPMTELITTLGTYMTGVEADGENRNTKQTS